MEYQPTYNWDNTFAGFRPTFKLEPKHLFVSSSVKTHIDWKAAYIPLKASNPRVNFLPLCKLCSDEFGIFALDANEVSIQLNDIPIPPKAGLERVYCIKTPNEKLFQLGRSIKEKFSQEIEDRSTLQNKIILNNVAFICGRSPSELIPFRERLFMTLL